MIAVAALWLWSVNGAKNSRNKVLTAVVRTIEDQVRNTPRLPSWHRDRQMTDLLERSLTPIPAQSSPFNPEIVREWLGSSLTRDDMLTFMHHAEALGFSQAEQVALAPEAAKAFLAQDLVKAPTIVDKMIMLRLVAATKTEHGQTILTLNEFAYPLVRRFFLDFGATDDRDDEADYEPMYLNCDFPFRDGTFSSSLELVDDPKAIPTVLVFNIKPARAWAKG